MKRFSIGVDIGGSHISCALVDMYEGHIVEGSHRQSAVDNLAPATFILDKWAETINALLENSDKKQIAGIGMAVPGPFDYKNGIGLFEKAVKFNHLQGVHFEQELSKRLSFVASVPIRFINDASAFAVGEAWLGKGAQVDNSVILTLGTGFGSAFVKKGVPVVEGENIPELGCLWHLPFKDGTADSHFSTRWFTNRWQQLSGEQVVGVKEINEIADANPLARGLFNEFGENMAEFMSPWLQKFGAACIVFGGNISGAFTWFESALKSKLSKNNIHVNILVSELKEDAAIIGSARLLDPEFFAKIEPALAKM